MFLVKKSDLNFDIKVMEQNFALLSQEIEETWKNFNLNLQEEFDETSESQ